ncbi:MAG: PEP-CTERM sorting domain-containing protein [Verrucomicrobia bacterium]|nr:PEP-CTERM sorting domain-containing protein [Verrucomicrobiota bacterium]
MSSKGAPTGKLKGDVVDTILPAGTTVSGLQIVASDAFDKTGPLTGLYVGASAPFSYTTGDAADPTKLPDGKLVYDAFTVEYIPEPTTIALGILGLSSLLVLRRRD